MENVVIKVGGMSCQGCVKNVTGALSGRRASQRRRFAQAAARARVAMIPELVVEALRSTGRRLAFDAAVCATGFIRCSIAHI